MRNVIVVIFSITFFISKREVVSTMIDNVSVNKNGNHTVTEEKNFTGYLIVGRGTNEEATCSQLNAIKSTIAPKTTTTSVSADKSEDSCQNLTEVHTCLKKSCKWVGGQCEDKNYFPVVPPETYVDTVHLFKSVMRQRHTPSRGNALFWLYFLGGSCAIVFFLAFSFLMWPLISCCRKLYYRLKGKSSKNDDVTMILPQGKKFHRDDYIIHRRVPRKGDYLLKQFLETTRSIPVKTPVATKKEDLESPHSWQYDPTKDKEENDKLFTASLRERPRVAKTNAHDYNDEEDICVSDTTKILNIPPEPQSSDDESVDNFVEVICEKENAETYSSTSTRSSIGDGETATSSSKDFNTLNATFQELDDVEKSKNIILLNLQSNLKNPTSSQLPAGKCHDYIIDRMPMEESTV